MDTILKILQDESYSGIRVLANIFCVLINTNKLSSAVAREMVAELTMNLA